MNVAEFLNNTSQIPSVESPEVIIMVAPPGSGKSYISEKYKNTYVVIDVDKLRPEPEDIEDIDEKLYRYQSQHKAEKNRDEIIERVVLKKQNMLIHVLTGSKYWYEQALNIHYSGYKVKFFFINTTKKQITQNIEKKNKEEREKQGYAIIAEKNFIDYSFETIPQLLLTTLKDSLKIVDEVILSNQEGEIYNFSKEDIYKTLRISYAKKEY